MNCLRLFSCCGLAIIHVMDVIPMRITFYTFYILETAISTAIYLLHTTKTVLQPQDDWIGPTLWTWQTFSNHWHRLPIKYNVLIILFRCWRELSLSSHYECSCFKKSILIFSRIYTGYNEFIELECATCNNSYTDRWKMSPIKGRFLVSASDINGQIIIGAISFSFNIRG